MNILKKEQKIEVANIAVLIYGAEGLGKTSLSQESEKPFLMDFDNGVHRSVNRNDSVIVKNWSDVSDIKDSDISEYSTVIIDTVGKMLDSMTVAIIEKSRSQRSKVKLEWEGSLTQNGWGVLKASFNSYIEKLKTFKKDIVLLSHEKQDTTEEGTFKYPDIQGGSKYMVLRSCDMIGNLYISGNKRMLSFDKSEFVIGKNTSNIQPLAIPDFNTKEYNGFFARLIQQTKNHVNNFAAENGDSYDTIANILSISNIDELNSFVLSIGSLSENTKKLARKPLQEKCNELKAKFNKETGLYELS